MTENYESWAVEDQESENRWAAINARNPRTPATKGESMRTEIKTEHLNAMKADLHERAAKLYREGRSNEGRIVGEIAVALDKTTFRPDSEYVRALGYACAGTGSTVRLRDHVEAIQRGEHPADSLPGQVRKMYAGAKRGVEHSEFGTDAGTCYRVTADVTADVLELLGVTP